MAAAATGGTTGIDTNNALFVNGKEWAPGRIAVLTTVALFAIAAATASGLHQYGVVQLPGVNSTMAWVALGTSSAVAVTFIALAISFAKQDRLVSKSVFTATVGEDDDRQQVTIHFMDLTQATDFELDSVKQQLQESEMITAKLADGKLYAIYNSGGEVHQRELPLAEDGKWSGALPETDIAEPTFPMHYTVIPAPAQSFLSFAENAARVIATSIALEAEGSTVQIPEGKWLGYQSERGFVIYTSPKFTAVEDSDEGTDSANFKKFVFDNEKEANEFIAQNFSAEGMVASAQRIESIEGLELPAEIEVTVDRTNLDENQLERYLGQLEEALGAEQYTTFTADIDGKKRIYLAWSDSESNFESVSYNASSLEDKEHLYARVAGLKSNKFTEVESAIPYGRVESISGGVAVRILEVQEHQLRDSSHMGIGAFFAAHIVGSDNYTLSTKASKEDNTTTVYSSENELLHALDRFILQVGETSVKASAPMLSEREREIDGPMTEKEATAYAKENVREGQYWIIGLDSEDEKHRVAVFYATESKGDGKGAIQSFVNGEDSINSLNDARKSIMNAIFEKEIHLLERHTRQTES